MVHSPAWGPYQTCGLAQGRESLDSRLPTASASPRPTPAPWATGCTIGVADGFLDAAYAAGLVVSGAFEMGDAAQTPLLTREQVLRARVSLREQPNIVKSTTSHARSYATLNTPSTPPTDSQTSALNKSSTTLPRKHGAIQRISDWNFRKRGGPSNAPSSTTRGCLRESSSSVHRARFVSPMPTNTAQTTPMRGYSPPQPRFSDSRVANE